MRMSNRDWGLLGGLALLWGSSFFFVALALRSFPPLTIVGARTGLAALILLAVLRIRGEGWPIRRDLLGAFVVLGLLNSLIPFSLLFWSQTILPSGVTSILNATTPIFTIIVAHFALADERMTGARAAGVGLGFLGVAVLLGGNLALPGPEGVGGAALLAMLACLGATFSYGLAAVYGRRFRASGLSAPQVAGGQMVASALMVLPILLVIDRPWQLAAPEPVSVWALIGLAGFSTALAYVVYFRLLASAGAVNAALVTLLVPVSAILLGVLVLGEALRPQHLLGMALIALGLLVIDGRLLRRR